MSMSACLLRLRSLANHGHSDLPSRFDIFWFLCGGVEQGHGRGIPNLMIFCIRFQYLAVCLLVRNSALH
jgi:hypothetical protein